LAGQAPFVALSRRWQTVSGAPVDTTLAHTMTLNVASQSQFFRLLK
jgi:hypothetical protein